MKNNRAALAEGLTALNATRPLQDRQVRVTASTLMGGSGVELLVRDDSGPVLRVAELETPALAAAFVQGAAWGAKQAKAEGEK